MLPRQDNKDNQINQHECGDNSFDIEQFRVFIFDGQPIERLTIEIDSYIDCYHQQNYSFYCYFYSIWLIVQHHEVHIDIC